MATRITTEEFIKKSIEKHSDKYDYHKVNYINNSTKVIIICKKHGEFLQDPAGHISNRRAAGCPKCKFEKLSRLYISNLDNFILKAQHIHGLKYDYSKVEYKGNKVKVCIICPDHGDWLQTPANHTTGFGCPKCVFSKAEIIIEDWMKVNNIKFTSQEWFPNSNRECRNPITNRPLRFDFYLPDYNLCIEYQGKQHYEPFDFRAKISKDIKTKNFEYLQLRDSIKKQYCINNDIKLLEIKYTSFNNIDKILQENIYKC